MKIIELIVSNYKRVKAITLRPLGEHLVIGGRNEQGKSSTIDALFAALCGGEAICEKPIREGALNSETFVDIGDYTVLRKLTPTGTTLTVKNKEGKTQTSPQALLDGLVGVLAFDPLEYVHMDPKAQRDLLARLAGLDFKALDAEYDALYQKRRDANREVDRLSGELAGRVGVGPFEEISVEALIAKLNDAEATNKKRSDANGVAALARQRVSDAEIKVEVKIETVRRLQAELAAAESQLRQSKENWDKEKTAYKEFQMIADALPIAQVSSIKAELAAVGEKNAAIRANVAVNNLRIKLNDARHIADNLDRLCQEKLSAKATAIRDAKYPLPGLALADDCVLFNGIPIKQASSKQQICIGASIGAALNPKLRVMVVRDGSLLDENNLIELLKWGTANDIQLLVERVGDGDECTVVIEDGEILNETK